MKISQGKVREKSGNFDILCEWQPCYELDSIVGFMGKPQLEYQSIMARLGLSEVFTEQDQQCKKQGLQIIILNSL